MPNQSENKQESLQPKRLGVDDKAYESVRDIVKRLETEDATNIALTGPYGSGKSSILITLKEDFKQYNYLSISLANLRALQDSSDNEVNDKEGTTMAEPDEEISKNNLDRLIEYSILQQIIYREKQETLPNSRLKRIYHISKNEVDGIAISTLLAIVAIIVVFEPAPLCVEWLCQLLGNPRLNMYGDILSLCYLAWFAYKCLQKIVPVLNNSRLNKLNLKNGEIEIVKNTSIFNKHLDEILYFFEMTEYNVVIIEDLDRFGSTSIFLKLRELNLLLNESNVIDRKIFFVYAVRDDMFKDEDRVKCFDYITTVIPVINRSNAKNMLKEELQKRGVTEISDKHMRDLGFFLHDMRLLKNIANEYVQYRVKLEKGIGCEKLLAIILYKNSYPRDFVQLHDGDGIVYKLIHMKDSFVAKRIAEIEETNRLKLELCEKHRKEKHLKEIELRRIYVDAYQDKINKGTLQFKIDKNYRNCAEVAKNEKLFEMLIADSNVLYSYTTSYYASSRQENTIGFSFSEIENIVNPSMSYRERLEALRADFDQLEDKTVIEMKKDDILSQTISQIMKDVDFRETDEYKKLNVPKMIEYLVVNGYIDENYYDYISYFYDNFIDAHDWEFVLDVKLGKVHDYGYLINNPEACLAEIPDSAYRELTILNFYIVDCIALLQNDRMNVGRQSAILRTIVENKKYDFLIYYYLNGHRSDMVFGALFSQYENLWDDFDQFDDEELHLKQIWYRYAEKKLSTTESQEWLSDHFDFVTDHMSVWGEEFWCSLIEKHPYQFKSLNGHSDTILDMVEKKGAFVLNKDNVETLISCFLKTEYKSASYKLVLDTGRQKLIDVVEADLGSCLKSVFSLPESSMENFESIEKILHADNVSEDDKIVYLKLQENKINFADFDTNDIKTLALRSDVIVPLWENVIDYMNKVSGRKTDENLITFIERHAEELSQIQIPQESKDDVQMLSRQLIETDVLSFEAYSKILNQFTRWYFSTRVPEIEERRILLLIEKGMVHFSSEITNDITKKYLPKVLVAYLLKNREEFLMNVESIGYTTETAQGLMESDLSVEEKSMIAPYINTGVLNEKIANQIVSLYSIEDIKVNPDYMIKVMQLSSLTQEKIKALNVVLVKHELDEGRISAMIKTLPEPYNLIAEKGKKPEIPSNEDNKKLVEALKGLNYISTFTENDKGIRVNTKLK